ncbi:MAG: Spy/CpxP family protein refolding chaperone [Candidatus Marinimicrobia bacterium]|nr:Spy/CpxP family protein refolding chaperone [Candidatus Neomarinimicrobiota bacterium]
MKRTLCLIITLLLAMPMAGGKASAQSFGMQRGPHMNSGFPGQDRMGGPGARRQGRRSKRVVRRGGANLSTAKMWMLTNELDLTEKQAAKLFPRMKDQQKQLDALSKKQMELYKAFDEKVVDEKASVKDIEKFADELAKIGKERIDLKTRFIKSTKDILKPEQQAVFAIFENRSRGRLRNRLMDSHMMIEMEPFHKLRREKENDDD